MSPILRWFCAGVLVAVSLWVSFAFADCNTCTRTGPATYDCTAMYCPDPMLVDEWDAIQKGKNTTPVVVEPKTLDCLAQMEAAMRVMDEYLPRSVFISGYLTGMEETATIMARGKKKLEKFDHDRFSGELQKIEEQWATVKQECWSKP